MKLKLRTFAPAAVLMTTIALVGCGGTVIDDVKAEEAIKQDVEPLGAKIISVDCPSGVSVESGATFECTIKRKGGIEETASVLIRNEDADIDITGLHPSK